MDPSAAANALTMRWASALGDRASLALSGAGLWPLLAILASAAVGPARRELEEAAGIEAAEGLRAAIELTAAVGDDARLAAGLWTRSGLPLTEWWRSQVPTTIRGNLTGDGDSDQAVLDRWVRARTAGRIASIPVAIGRDSLLLLASALAVDAGWNAPFQNSIMIVRSGPWTGRRLHSLERATPGLDDVAIIDSTAAGPLTLLCVRGQGPTDVYLALGSEQRRPHEVLAAALQALAQGPRGRPGSTLASGEQAPGLRVGTHQSFTPTPSLMIELPRFDVTASHDLAAHPALFGLASAMDRRRGHFALISTVPLAVNAAVQHSVASFTADGFQAATATAVELRVGGRPPYDVRSVSVSLDRPFAFMARHRPSRLVLVAGSVTDPEDVRDGLSLDPSGQE